MTIFGQLIIGPPGSGKTTYCCESEKCLKDLKRNVAIINLGSFFFFKYNINKINFHIQFINKAFFLSRKTEEN